MSVITRAKPKITISAVEIARRRAAVCLADAHNRIEGQFRGPETDQVFEAYARGEIAVTEIVPRLKLLYSSP